MTSEWLSSEMFFSMLQYHVRDRVSIIHIVKDGDATLAGLEKKTPDAPAKDGW